MKIGIYGGSFNPPHRGHLHAALGFYDAMALDLLLVIPDYEPPHKQLSGIDSAEMRLEMTKVCFSGESIGERKIEVSDFEVRSGGISYTALTLEHFREVCPEDEFFLLCGTDMFLTLDKWYHPETIFSLATPVLMRREDDPETALLLAEKQADYLEKYGKSGIILTLPCLELSSSEVREKIAAGEDVSGLLTPEVASYIKERELYRDEQMLATLRKKIVPIEGTRRAAHSFAVEEECIYLAAHFALSAADTLRLRIAALLHDLAHRLPPEEHKSLLLRHGFDEKAADSLLRYPKTVHQVTGALLLRERFSYLKDEAILSAISCHTTGKPGMSKLDMLLCLADYMEATRPYEDCHRARKQFHEALEAAKTPAEKDEALDAAMLRYLCGTVEHVQAIGRELDPMTVAARDDFLKKSENAVY